MRKSTASKPKLIVPGVALVKRTSKFPRQPQPINPVGKGSDALEKPY